jgi:hypothetical protein
MCAQKAVVWKADAIQLLLLLCKKLLAVIMITALLLHKCYVVLTAIHCLYKSQSTRV